MAKKVLSFIENLFDERELIYPYYRLQEAGYTVDVAGSESKTFTSKSGLTQASDMAYGDVNVDDYLGLLIPGGFAPDYMRRYEDAIEIVKKFNEAGKPIAMICHAGWVGIEADIVDGKRLTSVGSIRTDMINAGVEWVDEAPAIDGNIVTGRYPDDLPVYIKAFIEMLD